MVGFVVVYANIHVRHLRPAKPNRQETPNPRGHLIQLNLRLRPRYRANIQLHAINRPNQRRPKIPQNRQPAHEPTLQPLAHNPNNLRLPKDLAHRVHELNPEPNRPGRVLTHKEVQLNLTTPGRGKVHQHLPVRPGQRHILPG